MYLFHIRIETNTNENILINRKNIKTKKGKKRKTIKKGKNKKTMKKRKTMKKNLRNNHTSTIEFH